MAVGATAMLIGSICPWARIFGLASADWGLYLTLVAAIAVLGGAIGRTA